MYDSASIDSVATARLYEFCQSQKTNKTFILAFQRATKLVVMSLS